MQLISVRVEGRPAVIVGFAPGKSGVMAIVMGLEPQKLTAVPLGDCDLPKLPKKLQKRINRHAHRETREAMAEVGAQVVQ